MKTIESILKHAEQIGKEPGKPQDQLMISNIRIGMRVAIAECQRWMPIEEQSPENDSKVLLLAKHENGNIYITTYFNNRFCLADVTHWRPIELK